MKSNNYILRDSNLELYRIIIMIAMVAHHYVGNSGLVSVIQEEALSFKGCFSLIIGMWGKVGINCFVLITGYYMCKSRITLRKVLKLVLEVAFYIIIVWLAFFLCGYGDVGVKSLISTHLAYIRVSDGFVYCFVYFYLLIPFLNILINNIDKRQHGLLVVFLAFIYVVLGSIPKIGITMNYLEWFCVLYFVASYIRLYGIKWNDDAIKWGGIFLVATILAISSVVIIYFLSGGTTHMGLSYSRYVYFLVFDSNKILGVAVAISSFMFFKNLHMKARPLINVVAQAVFGVLLIHTNSDYMRTWLWTDTIDVLNQYHSQFYITYAMVSILSVYFICTIIDLIRIRYLEAPVLDFVCQFIENKWTVLYRKISF